MIFPLTGGHIFIKRQEIEWFYKLIILIKFLFVALNFSFAVR